MKLFFLGINYKTGKGGVATVLSEYNKIFPNATFISTSDSNIFRKIYYGISAIFKCVFLPIIYPKAIFHIHGSSYNSFHRKYIYFRILKFYNVKLIYHIHGAEYHLFNESSNIKTKEKIKYFINNVDCVICLSSYWKDFFLNHFNPKKIEVVANIVAIPKIQKLPSNDRLNFLFLGHISERKGVWLLLEVIESMKEQLKGQVIFDFGGNGEIEKFQKLIIRKKLQDIVNFIGWVSDNKKVDYLNKADVFILPSYNEGLPISILEAMTYSLPIISTKVGGIPEVVKDKVNGLIIAPGNTHALEKSISFVLKNKDELKSLGKCSFDLVKPHLPEQVKVKLIKIYNSI